jgi:hypothetical protein
MAQMSGRGRIRASWMLLVLFSSITLGICTAVTSSADGTLPCCPDVADGTPSFTACCRTGNESPSSDIPVALQTAPPQTWQIAFGAPRSSPIDRWGRNSFAEIPYRSADRQALLSTFLI